jgi:hypothetical protein
MAGNLCVVVPKKATKYNHKWSDIIKNWKFRNEKHEEYEEVWHYPNRRLSSLHEQLSLPVQIDGRRQGRNEKVTVWFFMDTSGSCVHLKDKFFQCADTFPIDKFDLRCFCFDTRVYDISLKERKLYGFGGTRFDIIETRIQEVMAKEKKKYPEVVFIFTDGYGNAVNPQKPENWYWFLDDSNYKGCIPSKSIVYNLADFEQ